MPWLRGLDELINLTPVFSNSVSFDSRKAPTVTDISDHPAYKATREAIRSARTAPRREVDPLVDITLNGELQGAGVPLSEAIPTNDDPGYSAALRDLLTAGEHHCGGGAAPHFILTLHEG